VYSRKYSKKSSDALASYTTKNVDIALRHYLQFSAIVVIFHASVFSAIYCPLSGVSTGAWGPWPPEFRLAPKVGPHFSCSNFTCSKLGQLEQLITF